MNFYLEFLVDVILFYDEKNHFKQKLLLWRPPQGLFKIWFVCVKIPLMKSGMHEWAMQESSEIPRVN